jgi:hypothetical protein
MKVHVVGLSALLIVSGLTIPVFAKDFEVSVPGWAKMSQKKKDAAVKNIARKNNLKQGRDKIIINDAETSYFIDCWILGQC